MYSQIKGLFLMRVINPFLMFIWVENENIGTTSEENGSFYSCRRSK
jgi:hypothetical protein